MPRSPRTGVRDRAGGERARWGLGRERTVALARTYMYTYRRVSEEYRQTKARGPRGGIHWPRTHADTQTCVDSVKGLAVCTHRSRRPGLCTRGSMGVHISTAAQSHARTRALEAPPHGHRDVHTITVQAHAGTAPDPRTHHNADVHAQALPGTAGHTVPCTLQNADAHRTGRADPCTHHTDTHSLTRPASHRTHSRPGRTGPWAGARTVTGRGAHTHTFDRTRGRRGAAAARDCGPRRPPAQRGAASGARPAAEGRGLRWGWGWGGGRSRRAGRERAPLRAALGPRLRTPTPRAPPGGALPRARPLAGPQPRPRGAARRPRRARGTGWRWGRGAGIGAGPRRPRCRAPTAAAAGARDGARGCGGRQHLPAGGPGGRGAAAAAAAAAAETQRAMGELTLASRGPAPQPRHPRTPGPPPPSPRRLLRARGAPRHGSHGPLPERDP